MGREVERVASIVVERREVIKIVVSALIKPECLRERQESRVRMSLSGWNS